MGNTDNQAKIVKLVIASLRQELKTKFVHVNMLE